MVRKILVLNSKGGCGKTTIATNLASRYARDGFATALLDYDPQASSMRWLSQRSNNLPDIFGVEACRRATGGITTSWALRVPPETQRIIIDAPAGVSGHHVLDYVGLADTIVIPVLPSPIDIHSATRFIEDLLLIGKVRQLGVRVGVVANRVKKHTMVYQSLERFLNSLKLPLITELRDTQHYIRAAGQGIGVCDLWDHRAKVDQDDWEPLLNWLESDVASTRIVKQVG
ncbi:MAG: ParA family protein [Gammaproteobacteria bacterium]|nr:ParA family protein [Gammaproteobacteria bacterium]MDH5651455.1 ParA family protein [Gammaproteobacteria bacterium]